MAEIIETPCGKIQGRACQWKGVTAYKGIRYATAGRWEYPQEITHWEGIYQADTYGNCSYQPRAFYDEALMPEKKFYYEEFRKGEQYNYSEDCLFLNIWVPEGAKPGDKLPVLFYIHGGGFTGGCGHEKHFDGPVWATKGVIAVTINYRLGPMGFVCLPQLKEEAGKTGNYGLYDQLTALQWIFHNIESFGGDSRKITIMGQSAGAMSVQQLVISPLTKGLVSGAVMSSGGGVGKFLGSTKPAENNFDFWNQVMEKAGCHTIQEFRNISPDKLFEAWQEVKSMQKGMGLSCGPCIDGCLIPEDSLKRAKEGKQLDIPYLIGTTSEDIVPFIVSKMAKDWCRLLDNQNKKPGYVWFFDRKLPGDENGAWHSSDLWYWFGTLKNCWRPMQDKDYELSNEMTEYLTNFAKTGNPNGQSLPDWKSFNKGQNKVLRLGEQPTHMGSVNQLKLLHTMLTKKNVGE